MTSKKSNKKKSIKEKLDKVHVYGSWGFLVVIFLIILGSIFNFQEYTQKIIISLLIILGIIIGLLNITKDEVVSFLVSTLVIVMMGQMFIGLIIQYVPFLKEFLTRLFIYLLSFVTPSAIVVSLIAIVKNLKD